MHKLINVAVITRFKKYCRLLQDLSLPLNSFSLLVEKSVRLHFIVAFIKKTKNNYFFTLTTHTGKVLFSRSMGNLGFKTKKKKISAFALFDLVSKTLQGLKEKYSVNSIKFLYTSISQQNVLRNILAAFRYHRIRILHLRISFPIAHNGIRGKKLRRL